MAQAIMTRSLAQLLSARGKRAQHGAARPVALDGGGGTIVDDLDCRGGDGRAPAVTADDDVPVLLGFVNLATSVMGRERRATGY
jgi:hypothetical protein